MRQEDNLKQRAQRRQTERTRRHARMFPRETMMEFRDEIGNDRDQVWRKSKNHPCQAGSRQQQPATYEQCQNHRWQQTAAQVIKKLPAIDHREPIRNSAFCSMWHLFSQPRQKLPVAAYPTMQAISIDKIVRRIIFE